MSKQKEPNQPQDSFSPKTTRIHISRRERRSQFYNIDKRNNDGTFKNSQTYFMFRVWNDQVIFIPRRHKLKGYEKEARRNSKRKAA